GLQDVALESRQPAHQLAQALFLSAGGGVGTQHAVEHAIGAQSEQGEDGNRDQQLQQREASHRPDHGAAPMKPVMRTRARSSRSPRSPRSGTRATSTTTRRIAGSLVAATSDRKSTRLNSSHVKISYAVFCLK